MHDPIAGIGALVLASAIAAQQPKGVITQHTMPAGNADGMAYQLFVPELKPGHTYPLMFTLHGHGQQAANYIRIACKVSTDECPLIVVAPQYQTRETGAPAVRASAFQSMHALLADVMEHQPVDRSRVILQGFSLGTSIAARWIDTFADQHHPAPFRAVWLHGGATAPSQVLEDVEFDLCVGSEETAVRGNLNILANVRSTYGAMIQSGFNATYIEVPGMNHAIDTRCLDFMRARLARWDTALPRLPIAVLRSLTDDLPTVAASIARSDPGAARAGLTAALQGRDPSIKGSARKALKALDAALTAQIKQLAASPSLSNHDALVELGHHVKGDSKLERQHRRALDKLTKTATIAIELHGREGWDAALATPPDDQPAALRRLAEGDLGVTWAGKRATAHLQAMGQPFTSPFVPTEPPVRK